MQSPPAAAAIHARRIGLSHFVSEHRKIYVITLAEEAAGYALTSETYDR
jgi:hypothetical protein